MWGVLAATRRNGIAQDNVLGMGRFFYQALKGRNYGFCAPSGLGIFFIIETRAMPWAITFCPFGASEADQRINRRTRGGGCLVVGVSERGLR